MRSVLKKAILHRSKAPCRAPQQRGAEILEAAIVLPVLLTLLVGIIWVGRAYNVYETMTRAAREGARFAIAPSCATCGNARPSDSEVANVINGALTASSLDPSQVSPAINVVRDQILDPSAPASSQVKLVVVTFGYPFQFVIPFTSLNLTTVTLSTQVQMRQEFQ